MFDGPTEIASPSDAEDLCQRMTHDELKVGFLATSLTLIASHGQETGGRLCQVPPSLTRTLSTSSQHTNIRTPRECGEWPDLAPH